MLQQTQVKTVIPYFLKFTKKFKTLKSLSKCNEKKILKMWEGLGYYRRAKNLLKTSKFLIENYNSQLPKSIEEIKKLPGVGDYTASALLGLVHDQPTIAIDGNVKRFFSRILNIDEGKINFKYLIENNKSKILNSSRNSDFVEALMEFGALVCKPKDPKCEICDLSIYCKYFNSSNKVNTRKYKIMKNKNYDVFCYINKKKQIALTNENNFGFLKTFSLPEIKVTNKNSKLKSWKFLKRYKNSISNKNLNINLYYKFSNKIPIKFKWHSLDNKKEFIPSFTKKILNQVSSLF